MILSLLGKRWKVKYVNRLPKDMLAFCHGPSTPRKEIRFISSIRKNPDLHLEVAIHEMLHALDWPKDEDWVTCAAHDMAVALKQMGFIKEER